jgi:hypothetical protein
MSMEAGHQGQPRFGDRVLALWALSFAATSFVFDRVAALEHGPLQPAASGPKAWLYWWATTYDPLIAANPLWLQIASGVSAFVFGPFYVWLALALLRGRCARGPAIVYAFVMLYSMVIFLGVHAFGELRPPNPQLVAALYAPYVLFPLILLWRFLPRPSH